MIIFLVFIATLCVQAASIPDAIFSGNILQLARRGSSSPAERQISNTSESRIVNYLLALQNIQNAFYSQGLANFTQPDFAATGLPVSARGRFVQIGEQQKEHVAVLSAAIGANATQPCNYTFPVTDVKSFTATAQLIEGVATSAYIGAMQNLSSPNILLTSSSILSSEARYAAWIASDINAASPWSGAFDTPLSLDQSWTLASRFIVSCPETNQQLNLNAFPPLSVSTGFPGANVTFSFDSSLAMTKANVSGATNDTQLFACFFSGLTKQFVPIIGLTGNFVSVNGSLGGGENTTSLGNTTASGNPAVGTVLVPEDVRGQLYAVVTNNRTQATDNTIVAGPTVFIFDFNSDGNVTSAANLTTVAHPNVTTGGLNLTTPSVTTTLNISTITVA